MSFDVEFCSDETSAKVFDCGKLQFSYTNNFETNHGCILQIFKDNLPRDAPIALCIGECGESVYSAGVLTLQLTYSSFQNVLHTTPNIFQDIFKLAKDRGSKGVYLVGFGFGAFVAAKLLEDRQFFKDNISSNLLQAVYLISGEYDTKEELIDNSQVLEETPPCGSSPKCTGKKPSLVDDLIRDKQSFEDRNNLSFICEFNDKSPTFGDFFTNNPKKYKQDHGLHIPQNKDLINSPVYQTNIGGTNKETGKFDKEPKCKNENSYSVPSTPPVACADDQELYNALRETMSNCSPLFQNFTHLCPMGIRLYVFAGEKDSLNILKQSRMMYDCISSGCETGNMHYQIKEKINKHDMKDLFKMEDNFLKRLLRYDIVKNL